MSTGTNDQFGIARIAWLSCSALMQPPSRLSGPGKPDGKPSRISITVPEVTYRSLLERSNRQGRSISSLAAFLLGARCA